MVAGFYLMFPFLTSSLFLFLINVFYLNRNSEDRREVKPGMSLCHNIFISEHQTVRKL